MAGNFPPAFLDDGPSTRFAYLPEIFISLVMSVLRRCAKIESLLLSSVFLPQRGRAGRYIAGTGAGRRDWI